MKLRTYLITLMAALSLAACGPDNNGAANNGNNANNGGNNTSNSDTNSNANSDTNSDTNSDANSDTNSSTNSDTNSATNAGTNADTNAGTNASTNANTNNGNDGDPLTCNGSFGETDACGGDPSGTWNITEACSDYDYAGLLQESCENATVENVTFDVSGTLTVAAGNFTQAVEGTASADVSIPSECNIAGCDGTATLLETAGAQMADCQDDGSGGCDCTTVFDAGDASAGSFTTDDGVATLDSGETYYYCASGGTLLLREFGTSNDEAMPTYLYEAQ